MNNPNKHSLRSLTEKMLTEREAIIYLLVSNSNTDYRTVAGNIGMSHENVRLIYERAKKKVDKFTEMGLYIEEPK